MKKKELESKILELEKKIIALEARPQTFFCSHTCTCNHINYPYFPTTPCWPNTVPWYTGPTWTSQTNLCGSGTANSSGFPEGTFIN